VFEVHVLFILYYRITDEVIVACKLLNGHLYKGKEIGREQMVFYAVFSIKQGRAGLGRQV